MTIRIVLYDDSAIERIKNKFIKYYKKDLRMNVGKNLIYMEDIFINFKEKLVIINTNNKINEYILRELLDEMLKNEQASICRDDRIEYSECYGKGENLIVSYK